MEKEVNKFGISVWTWEEYRREQLIVCQQMGRTLAGVWTESVERDAQFFDGGVYVTTDLSSVL